MIVESSVVIPRPLSEVERFISDVANDPKWNPEIRAAQRSASGPESTINFDVEVKPFMGITSCKMRVAQDPAAHVTRIAGSSVSWIDALATYTFEIVDGGTRVTRHCEVKVKGIMRLMEPMMRWQMAKKKHEMLAALRAYYVATG
jgi:carbon monoxide dehydrogenase subunit G